MRPPVPVVRATRVTGRAEPAVEATRSTWWPISWSLRSMRHPITVTPPPMRRTPRETRATAPPTRPPKEEALSTSSPTWWSLRRTAGGERMTGELFELELLGDAIERRYRKMRPEIDTMPWGTFDRRGVSPEALVFARKAWTLAAFQEHRTGIACAAALRSLFECRAPLDLIAMAARFPLDELAHVELCARMAMELGGGTEIQHDPKELIVDADESLPPLLRCADLVTRFFCVGEALSIPLLRGTWHAARHPLPRAVLGRIVKDEAAHGTFGFTFLDWAEDRLSDEDRAYLGRQGDRAIRAVYKQWAHIKKTRLGLYDEAAGDALAWMQSDAYLALAARSLEEKVKAPLRARNIPSTA